MTKTQKMRISFWSKLSSLAYKDSSFIVGGLIRFLVWSTFFYLSVVGSEVYIVIWLVHSIHCFISIIHFSVVGEDVHSKSILTIFGVHNNLFRIYKFAGKRSDNLNRKFKNKLSVKQSSQVFIEKNDFSNGYFLYQLMKNNINYKSNSSVHKLFNELQRMVDRNDTIDPFFIECMSKYLPLVSELKELEQEYLSVNDTYRKSDLYELLIKGLAALSECLDKDLENKMWALNYVERKKKTLDSIIEHSKALANKDNEEMTLEK